MFYYQPLSSSTATRTAQMSLTDKVCCLSTSLHHIITYAALQKVTGTKHDKQMSIYLHPAYVYAVKCIIAPSTPKPAIYSTY